MLSKLDTVSFSDSIVMAIPEDPNVDTVSEEVGHTHLTKQSEEIINLVNVKGKWISEFQQCPSPSGGGGGGWGGVGEEVVFSGEVLKP